MVNQAARGKPQRPTFARNCSQRAGVWLKVRKLNTTAAPSSVHFIPGRRSIPKSGCWTDSEAGSRFVERMLTIVATCRQQDINVLDYLTRCFQAHLGGQPAPSLLPASTTAPAA
jgi:hypothetical protein